MFEDDRNDAGLEDRPPDTLLEERVMNINGENVVIGTEAYMEKPDGTFVRQKTTNYQIAQDGRWLPMDEYVGISWTGLTVPKDRTGHCLNPFELHDLRLVYLDIDGFVTDQGNVLCTECFEYQEKKLFWKKVLLFGLLYNPEEF
jgi:hypothetical protein